MRWRTGDASGDADLVWHCAFRGAIAAFNKVKDMGLTWNLVRVIIIAATVVAVAELSKRFPRVGALLLSLPLVSILAFVVSWFQHRDLPAISRLARETLVLVPLGLPFFVPIAFAERLGMGFWSSLAAGVVLASLTIGAWLFFTARFA